MNGRGEGVLGLGYPHLPNSGTEFLSELWGTYYFWEVLSLVRDGTLMEGTWYTIFLQSIGEVGVSGISEANNEYWYRRRYCCKRHGKGQ